MPGVLIGLRDLHYAKLIKDDDTGVTYDTPKRIIGAVQANINPNPSSETLFADDGPMETSAALGQIELEIVASDFPLEVQAELLGHTIDTKGIMKRMSNDVAPWVAVGFRALKSNGAYRFTWLVKGRFSQPEQSHETKGDTVNFQTPTLNGSFVKRDSDDVWIVQTDEDATGYVAATGNDWFEQVDPLTV